MISRMNSNDHFYYLRCWKTLATDSDFYNRFKNQDFEGIKHRLYRKPFAQVDQLQDELRGSVSCIWLPVQGWVDGTWCDGPIVDVDSNGQIAGAIPMGSRVELSLQRENLIQNKKPAEEIPERFIIDHCYWLDSLGLCAESLISPPTLDTNVLSIPLSAFDLHHAVCLAIVRRACPLYDIFVETLEDYKKWPSTYKRLCQNLGIQMYETLRPIQSAKLDTERLLTQIKPVVHELETIINQKSAVIPKKILG